MNVREDYSETERRITITECPWKTEEGIQQLRDMAVPEVLFGRDGQHSNNPAKVRCTGKMEPGTSRAIPVLHLHGNTECGGHLRDRGFHSQQTQEF